MNTKSKRTLMMILACSLLLAALPVALLAETEGYEENLEEKVQKGTRVDTFQDLVNLNKTKVEKRNAIEKIVYKTNNIPDYAAYLMNKLNYEKDYNAYAINRFIALAKTMKEKVLATNSEYLYVAHTDGSIVWLKDGLPSRIENERVLDQFGNLSLHNTYNMQYNSQRLLISYEKNVVDQNGKKSHIEWSGDYTPGSMWYADNETVAYKNYAWYKLKETDEFGHVTETYWKALAYDGKLARSIEVKISDSIKGTMSYTRSNITYAGSDPSRPSSWIEKGYDFYGQKYETEREYTIYNDRGQVIGYKETTYKYKKEVDENGDPVTDENGDPIWLWDSTVATTAQFTYLNKPHFFSEDVDPEDLPLAQSIITTETENADGSRDTTTETVNYIYDSSYRLSGAYSESDSQGKAASYYTDSEEHSLKQKEDGTFYYIETDDDGNETEVIVDAADVTKENGTPYKGWSKTTYEICGGIPMPKQIESYSETLSRPEDLEQGEEQVVLSASHRMITYENGIVAKTPKMFSQTEKTEETFPDRDPENNYPRLAEKTMEFQYDQATGNLEKITCSGSMIEREYSDTSDYGNYYGYTLIDTYEISEKGEPELKKSEQIDPQELSAEEYEELKNSDKYKLD